MLFSIREINAAIGMINFYSMSEKKEGLEKVEL